MKGLSTLTEIMTRGKIYAISKSIIKQGVWIIIFASGDQANVDEETFKKLDISI
jgi:hypothetical protein